MPLLPDNTYQKRSIQDIQAAIISALRQQFGQEVDVSNTGTFRKIVEALGSLPLAEQENDLDNLRRQMFAIDATGQALDDALWPSYTRLTAERAQGNVHISLKAVETGGGPLFAAGSITFVDTAGNLYSLPGDIEVPGKAFDGTQTGTASETIGASNTKFAQRFEIAAQSFVQGFAAKTTEVTPTATFTVRVETSSGGEPSGTLAADSLEATDFAPTSTILTTGVFTEGALIEPGVYWLVFERTAGEATFDGGTGGTADQVKIFAGASWALSSNIENANVDVHEGATAFVIANDVGPQGNILANGLGPTPNFNDAGAATDWANKVESHTNLEAFSGGRDTETDGEFKRRVRDEAGAVPSASVDGLEAALVEAGAFQARVIENAGDTGSALNVTFSDDSTGTASEAIDATPNTRIARKVTTTEERYTQNFTMKLDTDNSSVFTVRLETDSAGDPSGTLVDPDFERTGFTPAGTAAADGTFVGGAYLPAGAYWLVFELTSGDAVFDGGVAGSAGDVKVYSGSWANDANINQMFSSLVGGLPPHSLRAYQQGLTADETAQVLWDNKAAGIKADGILAGNATDRSGGTQVINYEEPTAVPLVMDIIVKKNTDFNGTEDDIRDIVIRYVGGTETDGDTFNRGLSLSARVINDRITGLLTDPAQIEGTTEVTQLRIGKKASFPTPGSLTGAEEGANIAIDFDEYAIIEDPADLAVTLVDE